MLHLKIIKRTIDNSKQMNTDFRCYNNNKKHRAVLHFVGFKFLHKIVVILLQYALIRIYNAYIQLNFVVYFINTQKNINKINITLICESEVKDKHIHTYIYCSWLSFGSANYCAVSSIH